jgi:hypothetical protein
MTNQEAFSKVKAGVNAQGGPAYNGYKCVYRAPDGKKCAAGQLIPDDEYTESLEGSSVVELDTENRLPPSLAGINIDLLRKMQMAHDCASELKYPEFLLLFNNNMSRVAAQFNLKDE